MPQPPRDANLPGLPGLPGLPDDEITAMAGFFTRPAPVNRRHPRREETVTYRIRVELDESSPSIWRRLDVASDMMLPRLHLVIQEAMGWSNSHLHEFVHSADRRDREAERFESFDHPDAGEFGSLDEADARVDELLRSEGDAILYSYDFGDDWTHTVVLEEVLPRDADAAKAVLVAGERACPPEDFGGIYRYDEYANGDEPVDPELTAFYGEIDPAAFDLDEARERVAGALDSPATVHEVRLVEADNILLLIEHLGSGVKLTQAGYLPPKSVRHLMSVTGWDRLWIGACNREDWTYPITELRHWAQELGLTRKYKGELRPTRLGASMLGDREGLAGLIDRSFPFDHLYGAPFSRF